MDPDDTADPAATRAALEAASFVVSLEQRETDVTRLADVVLPVAPVTDKAGTFVTWEGRPRPFEAVFSNPGSLPDLRVLAGIADELAALGQGSRWASARSPEVRAEMEAMGPWDGARPEPVLGKEPRRPRAKAGALVARRPGSSCSTRARCRTATSTWPPPGARPWRSSARPPTPASGATWPAWS